MVKTVDHSGFDGSLEWRRMTEVLVTNRTDFPSLSQVTEMILFVDARDEDHQRKSSPRKEMFGGRVPVATVRKSEWRKKSFYSEESFVTDLEDPLQYLQSELECSQDEKIFLNNNVKNYSEREKFLLRTGEVKEVWKLKLSCLTDQFSCKTNFPNKVTINCRNVVMKEESRYYESSTKRELEKMNIMNSFGTRNKYCCKNLTHFTEIFGNLESIDSNILKNDCQYSNLMQEKNMELVKTYFKICQIGDFIVKETHMRNAKGVLNENCDVSKYIC